MNFFPLELLLLFPELSLVSQGGAVMIQSGSQASMARVSLAPFTWAPDQPTGAYPLPVCISECFPWLNLNCGLSTASLPASLMDTNR